MAGLGKTGPIPKDPNERVRRNKTGEDGLATEVVEMTGPVEVPELPELDPFNGTHPIVQGLWNSLPSSGQTRHWEPSDWNYAILVMYAINEMMYASAGMPAMKLSAVDGMMSKLLLTVGDRRRVKLEVERNEKQDAAVINAEHFFKAQFDKQAEANRRSG